MLVPIVNVAYIAFVLFVVFACGKAGLRKIWIFLIAGLLILGPFWDIWLAKGIMWNYARHNSPLQHISRTVEQPESVLWVDNVWPGYDAYGRHWMVQNYLDGVHLKTLVLMGTDNKYYLYHATLEDFSESEAIRPAYEKMNKMIKRLKEEAKAAAYKPGGNKALWRTIHQVHEPRLKKLGYKEARKKEIEKIFARETVYSSLAEIPPVNYQVEFNRIDLPEWQEKYIWCDEIKIKDNSDNEDIAFSKRCLGYSPKTGVNPLGKGSPFYGGARLGEERVYEFDDKVLFRYAGVRGTQWSRDLFEKSSYKGGALNWKSKQKREGNDHE